MEEYIINKEKFISSGFGDEMMLMNLETGDYVGLNTVSADIYKLAGERTTASRIIHSLLQKYDVEEAICTLQVTDCIQKMIEKELLIKI